MILIKGEYMNIKIKQVNLLDETRAYYSQKLQSFEREFSYPLGDESFTIIHGAGPKQDYFSFFEQIGDVYYFIAQDEEKIVGAGCAILRNGNEGKYWYLCDFKILKEYRGRGILEKMFKKYFLKCVLKSRKLLAVNMGNGNPNGNGLFNKLKRVFWMFNVNVNSLNFYSWNKSSIPDGFTHIYHNNGKKDLVLDNNNMPLYHVMKNPLKSFTQIKEDEVPDNAVLMTCLKSNDDIYSKGQSGKGIMISIGLKNPTISTVEI